MNKLGSKALDARCQPGHRVAHTLLAFAEEAPVNTVVRARIDQATKDEATLILDTIGLTVSDAFRLMMRRIVAEKRLPFDPLVPNATTLAAIDDANRGDLDTVDSVEELFATLRDGRDDDQNDPTAPSVQTRLPARKQRTAPTYRRRHPRRYRTSAR